MTEQSPHSTIGQAAQELASQSKSRVLRTVASVTITVVLLAGVILYTIFAIQNSRFDACVQQNHQHDSAVAYIVKLTDRAERTASKTKHEALQVAVAEDRVLLQDLEPHKDCAAVVGFQLP